MIPVISSNWLFHFHHTFASSELLMMQLVNEAAAVEMQQSSLQTALHLLRGSIQQQIPLSLLSQFESKCSGALVKDKYTLAKPSFSSTLQWYVISAGLPDEVSVACDRWGQGSGSGWFRWIFWNQNIDLEWFHEDSICRKEKGRWRQSAASCRGPIPPTRAHPRARGDILHPPIQEQGILSTFAMLCYVFTRLLKKKKWDFPEKDHICRFPTYTPGQQRGPSPPQNLGQRPPNAGDWLCSIHLCTTWKPWTRW